MVWTDVYWSVLYQLEQLYSFPSENHSGIFSSMEEMVCAGGDFSGETTEGEMVKKLQIAASA